jgi:rubrerythrin
MADSMSNLEAAFAGESQANRRYLAFAEQAEKDGLPNVARRFRVAAASETVHAINHLKAMGGVKETAENLKAAMGGENYEHTNMYPEFLAIAKGEGNSGAVWTFNAANEAEKFHEVMFAEAAAAPADAPAKTYYVCQVCGMTYETAPPEHCIVCGAGKAKILEVS